VTQATNDCSTVADARSRSADDLARFIQMAAHEPELVEDFWHIADRKLFIERVVQRGETVDCWFSAEHVEDAMRTAWQVWLGRANR
jgi:hypothetical protein